jgi:hypothetical protein
MQRAKIPAVLRRWAIPRPWKPGYIWGPTGVGKSVEAACRLVTGALETQSALWVSVPELVLALRLAASRTQEEGILDEIIGKKRLVLDDLTMLTEASGMSFERVYMLVNYRYSRPKLETLVTGNLAPEELAHRYGEQMASRIMGFGDVLGMSGPDKRLESRDLFADGTQGIPGNEPYLGDLPPVRPVIEDEKPLPTRREAERLTDKLSVLRAKIAEVYGMADYQDVWEELMSEAWDRPTTTAQQKAKFERRAQDIASAVRTATGHFWELVGSDRPGWWWPMTDAAVLAERLGLPDGPAVRQFVLSEERSLIGHTPEQKKAARDERAAVFEAARQGKRFRLR